MKVFDLRCEQGHVFEGWFASGEAFESQQANGLIACPVCSITSVAKLPAAPRLNLSGAKAPAGELAAKPSSVSTGTDVAAPAAPSPPATAWVQALREALARSENVGDRFAEEARKMHYGESEERGIHGRATREQAEALLDEGIAVVALSLPGASNETLH